MKKKIAILVMSLLLVFTTVGSAVTPTYKLNSYYPYGKEATRLSEKISKLKDKYHLKYKSDMELTETCWLICQHSKYTKFSKYEIASVVMEESKFDQFALSRCGAKGLGQLHNVRTDYKEQLPFLKDEYNKNQNILGTVIVLQDKLKTHKTKYLTYVRYNGKVCNQSLEYGRRVERLKKEIERI